MGLGKTLAICDIIKRIILDVERYPDEVNRRCMLRIDSRYSAFQYREAFALVGLDFETYVCDATGNKPVDDTKMVVLTDQYNMRSNDLDTDGYYNHFFIDEAHQAFKTGKSLSSEKTGGVTDFRSYTLTMIKNGHIGNVMQLTGTPIHGQDYDETRMFRLGARHGIKNGTLVDADAMIHSVSKDPSRRLKEAAKVLAFEQKSGIIRLSKMKRCYKLKAEILKLNPKAVVYICTSEHDDLTQHLKEITSRDTLILTCEKIATYVNIPELMFFPWGGPRPPNVSYQDASTGWSRHTCRRQWQNMC